MKTFLLISPKNRSVYNFRGNLIKHIQKAGYQVFTTGPDRTNLEYIEELGVTFCEIPMNKTGTSIRGDLRYLKNLYTLMKRIKPDAVLGYTVKPVIYGILAAWLAKVPHRFALITGGGYTFTSKSLKARILGIIVKFLYKSSLSHAEGVLFQNQDDLCEFTEGHLVKKEKCHVVHGSGVDVEHFAPVSFPVKTTFFMLSRLLKCKGVIEYLKAAELVKQEYPETRFMLLGKYDYSMQDAVPKEYVEEFIQKGIVERFDETHDVRPYYAACSVCVLPSYREGTPRTVLEAMAMGRPIVTTDTNGCRDTVIDGKTGFLVPIQNVEELASKMKYFVEHPEKIDEMGSASRIYCVETFEVNGVSKAMLRFMNL